MADHTESALLHELAVRYGVLPEYHDIWGQVHRNSDETNRLLLAAMGVPTESVEGLRRTLADLDEAPWRSICEPVVVHRVTAGPVRWSVVVPVEEAEDQVVTVRWELHGEGAQPLHRGRWGPGLRAADGRLVGDRRHARFELSLPDRLGLGYYDLAVQVATPRGTQDASLPIILVPDQCYTPFHNHATRRWGLAVHLYALHSQRSWGVGDFGDLARVTEWAARDLGAALVGLNPLHALQNSRPYHISPYSPDTRLFRNVLYLDIERIPDFADSSDAQHLVGTQQFRETLAACRAAPTVQYEDVYRLKLDVLEALYATFRTRHLGGDGRATEGVTKRGKAFADYVREEGVPLRDYATFQALREKFRREYPDIWVWQDWPEPYRRPDLPAVEEFRAAHQQRVEFHAYLQWVADDQLTQAAGQAHALGMAVGLYHDMALGSDRGGSEAWAMQDVVAWEVDCGAPPDDFSLEGQNWGIAPMHPHRLRGSAYRPFVELVRRNLDTAGALRIDHVMSLFRLFWVPRGHPARMGAYVAYPVEDLLGILALESIRHRAVIIGEDLGTVPDEVRTRLSAAHVLSYRVLYFERNPDGTFKTPSAYPAPAAAVVSTHDLATLTGFWVGTDIEARTRLELLPDEAAVQRAWDDRAQDKRRLLEAVRGEGLLPDGVPEDPAAIPEMTPALAAAIHAYLARTPSWIMLAALEDIVGEPAQKNLPGTVDSYPNWSYKSVMSLEDLMQDARPRALADLLRHMRPGGPAH